jgi:hypothetical protein
MFLLQMVTFVRSTAAQSQFCVVMPPAARPGARGRRATIADREDWLVALLAGGACAWRPARDRTRRGVDEQVQRSHLSRAAFTHFTPRSGRYLL